MNVMLPTNDQFVETIAKAIARDRLVRETTELLETVIGLKLPDTDALENKLDHEFDILWNDPDEEFEWNRINYRADAVAAINKINLLLLTGSS